MVHKALRIPIFEKSRIEFPFERSANFNDDYVLSDILLSHNYLTQPAFSI